MIYFKKKLIKNFVINLYILINSFLVIINSLFYRGNQKKDQIKIFYGGSLTGSIGGT